jgi:prepilin-type N-terminal cleavage/methylation domain-containing protein
MKEAAMRVSLLAALKKRGPCVSNRAKRRGFTLIEVVAATAVTVVGLVSTFYLVGLGSTVNSDAKNVSQAYQICQQEIELLRNMPFATLQPLVKASTASGTPESRFLKADGTDDASRPGDTGYPGLIANLGNLRGGSGGVIITNDATASNQAKHVTVVVRWTDPNNQARSAIVGTIIAQGGMGAR